MDISTQPTPDSPQISPLLADVSQVYGSLTSQITTAWTLPKPLTLRHNVLLDPSNLAQTELQSLGFVVTPQVWYPQALLLTHPSHSFEGMSELLNQSQALKKHLVYRQNLASMIPPLLLELQPHHQVLDIAAAPGSKTSQIAALLNNTGSILANDISQSRLYKLQANLSALGISNTTLRHGLGEKLWQDFPAVFDAALADVPCSMSGRYKTTDATTTRAWSNKESKSLAKRQQWLLLSALSTVKTGGVVVYATCTLNVLENESVVNWVLQHAHRPINIEPIEIPGFPQKLDTGEQVVFPGITAWQRHQFHSDLKNTWRIVPNSLMEGFYVAKLRVLPTPN